MTERDFCYWLNGFAELNSAAPTEGQWASIRDHLGLVFKKVTPARGGTVKAGVPYIIGEKPTEELIDIFRRTSQCTVAVPMAGKTTVIC